MRGDIQHPFGEIPFPYDSTLGEIPMPGVCYGIIPQPFGEFPFPG